MFSVKKSENNPTVNRGDLLVINNEHYLLVVKVYNGINLIALDDDCNRFIDIDFREGIFFEELNENLLRRFGSKNNIRLIKNKNYTLTLEEGI